MKKETNTLEIPQPFMTDGEKKEYEQAREIMQKSREQKFEDAIFDLHFYSQRRRVLDVHLPIADKEHNWQYNNSLEKLLEASQALLETYKKLNQ